MSWSPISNGLTASNITSIAFIGSDIFVGAQNGVFRSTNNGVSWTTVNNGLTITSVYCLLATGSSLIAGTVFGMYVTTNNGTSWTGVNAGLPGTFGLIYPSVLALTSASNGTGGTDVFAGTFLLGAWRRPSSQITGVQLASSGIPDGLTLFQNYPNPFNPTTTIRFSTDVAANVKLKVFDLLGKEIATLVNGELMPGSYETKFDASKLASGVYFYRLQAGNFVQTKKFLLQK